jgi:hypothetical protein
VTLGEKEVQIWFQNRRQNSRKKAKLSISQASSSTDASDSSSLPALEHPDIPPTSVSGIEKNDSPITSDSLNIQSTGCPESSQSDLSSSQSSHLSFSSQQSSTSGYLANRRITTSPAEEVIHQPAICLPGMKGRSHVRSGSYLRLSMTDDGKAKVVDRGIPSPSPSPEKQLTPLPGGASLRRRYTTAGTTDEPKQSIDGLGRNMRAPAVGRSRDSRTWEFWCDSDARNSLIERAEQEASGSAAEAIGLIRSSSNRKALKFNMRKMNASPAAVLHAKGAEPSKMHKAKLKRSSTHSGAAVISPNAASSGKDNTGKKGTKEYTAEDFEHLNSESDKENFDPRKGGGRPRVRRAATVPPRDVHVLGESTKGPAAGASIPPRRAARPAAGQSTPPVHVDAEVSAFMAGGCSATASSMPEELDCVQSLLSLSQGNWD